MHFLTKRKFKCDFLKILYRIERMRINSKDHMELIRQLDPKNPHFEVHVCPELGTLIAGGIEIFGTILIDR